MTAYRVRHRTEYRYGAPVSTSHTLAHLVPRATGRQEVAASTISSEPPADHMLTHIDAFGNVVTFLGIEQPHEQLVITATSEVRVVDPDDVAAVPDAAPAWDDVARTFRALAGGGDGASGAPAELPMVDELQARLHRLDSPLVAASERLAAFAAPSFPPGRPLDEAVRALSSQLHTELIFDPEFSDVTTPIEQVLEARRGVCQDFAHLAIGCLRSLGLPARYVSGYLETHPPPGQPKLVGADASHAWCSAYVPGQGWIDFDPTNDQVPPRDHVTVAWGRDYSDVAPVRGVVFGPSTVQDLTVAVDVERL